MYRVAGDDVDFCWRLIHANLRIGFSGGAFVWHRRRTTLVRYFKQQLGYGKAEALLMRNHPHKFKLGSGASWKGQVYEGGALSVHEGSVIYHGAMGTAPYQQISLNMQPQRPLIREFNNTQARFKLTLAQQLQPWLRKYARWRHSLQWRKNIEKNNVILTPEKPQQETHEIRWWSDDHLSRETVPRHPPHRRLAQPREQHPLGYGARRCIHPHRLRTSPIRNKRSHQIQSTRS